MTAIRVLLGDMTPMFHSVVTGLIAASDEVELVQSPAGHTMADHDVDVLLIRSADIVDCPAVLSGVAQSAPMGVVAIQEDGLSGTAYRILREPAQFDADGRVDLISAIRCAAGRT
jgi:hypothetical protein